MKHLGGFFFFNLLLVFNYSSGELRAAPHVPVPVQVHSAHMKQTTHFGLLLSCLDLWDQADQLVRAGKHEGNYFKADSFEVFCCIGYYLFYFIILNYCTSFFRIFYSTRTRLRTSDSSQFP